MATKKVASRTSRSIRRILVCVRDPGARSIPALAKAIQLSRAFGARIRIFHAITAPIYLDPFGGGPRLLGQIEASGRDRILGRLKRLTRRVSGAGVRVDAAVEWDYPVQEAIVRAARRFQADLIVAESHVRHHLAPWLLSFADWELLRASALPVLLVKTRRSYRRPAVLAALDPSHAYAKPAGLDQRILRYAQLFAAELRGTLHAVHAYNPLPVGMTAAEMSMPNVLVRHAQAAAAQARTALSRSLASLRLTKAKPHVSDRHPADAIADVAHATRSQLVVMGAISRSGLKRLLVGDTAERTLDRLRCDVLVIKPKLFRARAGRARRGSRVITLATQPSRIL